MRKLFALLDVVSEYLAAYKHVRAMQSLVRFQMERFQLTERVLIRLPVMLEDPRLHRRQAAAKLELMVLTDTSVRAYYTHLCTLQARMVDLLAEFDVDPSLLKQLRQGTADLREALLAAQAAQIDSLRKASEPPRVARKVTRVEAPTPEPETATTH